MFKMKDILKLLSLIFLISEVFSKSDEWSDFKGKYGRTYKSAMEEQLRYSIFQANLNKIQAHNQDYKDGKTSYYLEVNQFADMISEEFSHQRLSLMANLDVPTNSRIMDIPSEIDVPESLDWRDRGAVTEVRDQGMCGCCYIFAAIGSIESQHFLKSGNLTSLSAQQILDCDQLNNKCEWGWPQKVYEHIELNGAVLIGDYPMYQGIAQECRAHGTLFKGMGFIRVPNNEDALKFAVATLGPVAVSIDATNMSLYAGGVYFDSSCSSTATNHVVVVVGYGNADGHDYWLVKNSWGTSFGEEGYIKMARNKNNNCAVASYPYVPQL